MASGAFWQTAAYLATVLEIIENGTSQTPTVSSAPATAPAPTVAPNKAGQLAFSAALPSVEKGFVPVTGSFVLYTEGSVLKVA